MYCGQEEKKMTQYVSEYQSPLGKIVLAADETGLSGLWFDGQKYFARGLSEDAPGKETDIIRSAKAWLDIYFSGQKPDFTPPLHLAGTKFQTAVWERLLQIPYGTTTTYGNIAGELSGTRGNKTMSAQAVGGAVGRNPVSIIVPCHRVVGSRGQLTGYAGGLERKRSLLNLEGAEEWIH